MTIEDVMSKMTAIVKDVLDLDDLTLTSETTASEVEDWDSIMHVEIIVAVEEEFGVKFTTMEIEKFNTVGDIAGLTLQKANG